MHSSESIHPPANAMLACPGRISAALHRCEALQRDPFPARSNPGQSGPLKSMQLPQRTFRACWVGSRAWVWADCEVNEQITPLQGASTSGVEGALQAGQTQRLGFIWLPLALATRAFSQPRRPEGPPWPKIAEKAPSDTTGVFSGLREASSGERV